MEFDKNLAEELNKILNSKQGDVLKEQLKNVDKNKLEAILKSVDLSKVDINDVKRKLQSADSKELTENLKNIAEKYLGGKNG